MWKKFLGKARIIGIELNSDAKKLEKKVLKFLLEINLIQVLKKFTEMLEK